MNEEIRQRENIEHGVLYEVVYPLGRCTAKDLTLARNIGDLRGKTICGSGHSYHGDEAVAEVVRALQQQYPGLKFVPNAEIPDDVATKEEMARLQGILREKGCDVLIAATGA